MLNFSKKHKTTVELYSSIQEFYRVPEKTAVEALLSESFIGSDQTLISDLSGQLIQSVRNRKLESFSIEHFLQIHKLSSQEGLALMCLAEALLRIPDSPTRTKLVRDKISSGDWVLSSEDSLIAKFTNLSLLASSKIITMGLEKKSVFQSITSLIRRFGEPLIRQIMAQAVKIMGYQFVMGETIEKAIARSEKNKNTLYSYDMLGEAAYTQEDAERYYKSYYHAIESLGQGSVHPQNPFNVSGISIKLSALHPRYGLLQRERVIKELFPKLLELCLCAQKYNLNLTIDAEESENLILSLDLFKDLYTHGSLVHWEGLGLAVQAYQKRAVSVINWLVNLSNDHRKRLGVRLVKGAYWDGEIKKTQERGLSHYPVFTRKCYTDASYLVCANKILENSSFIYGQFATHNAHTLASVCYMAESLGCKTYEFQRLHGMGQALYEEFEKNNSAIRCSVYAPVGHYRDLLAYLVRRLLENGANSSFVNQIYDKKKAISTLIQDPLEESRQEGGEGHPRIPLPKFIFAPDRLNSQGIDLWDEGTIQSVEKELHSFKQPVALLPTPHHIVQEAVYLSTCAYEKWDKTPVEQRALCLEKLGDLFQLKFKDFLKVLVKEGKKTILDATAEIRETIDFCYYYARQARNYQGDYVSLPGPTGELNYLSYHSRGVFVCISPWNFPLAIFMGQILAALVVGNTVIAKPASQTSYIAEMAIDLAHQAGIPRDCLRLLIISGEILSSTILTDSRIAGVAFTGSSETAKVINHTLASNSGPLIPLIAETGGINAMIVDSSALPEQVVRDVLISAFQSAGQRCSSLRVLFIQNEILSDIKFMLIGAMKELKIGQPTYYASDIGPVIDEKARKELLNYSETLHHSEWATLLYACCLPESLYNQNFVPPQLWQVPSLEYINKEVFGPILHLIPYRGEHIDHVIDDINKLRYGLTLGVHSRLESTIQRISQRARVGNLYINRNMIGAVVGSQPFGGEGLSGTGFKAGGPNYLLRFMVERTLTQDTTASGGNASLLSSI